LTGLVVVAGETIIAGAAGNPRRDRVGRARVQPERLLEMTSPTEEFFDELSRRGHEPLLEKATGTVRFEIVEGLYTTHWFVTIEKGDVTVTRDNAPADSVLRVDREMFDRVASGQANLMAALLRGALAVEGNLHLLTLFGRLLPGPPDARERQPVARRKRRHS
jgi:putative sterol carrier protein